MPRRLYRSRDDRILGGVAAGVAAYFRIDPTIVRLAWLLIVLWGGAGIFLYIIAWIIVPLEPSGRSYTAAASETARGEPGGGQDGSGWTSSGSSASEEPRGSRRASSSDREQSAIGWALVGVGILLVLFGTNIISWLFNPTVMLAVLFVVVGLFFLGRDERPPRVR